MADSFFQFVGAETVSCADGVCVQRLALRPELLQRLGVVHGGIIAALVDDAIGRAANDMLDLKKEIALTAELSVNYLASAGSEGTLEVEGRIIRLGNTTGYGEASVHLVEADDSPKLLARGSALLIRKKRR